MSAKSKLRVILAVFLGMIVLETSMFVLNLYQESRSVERGAERGFDLAGTYGNGGVSQENDENDSIRSASFVPDTSNEMARARTSFSANLTVMSCTGAAPTAGPSIPTYSISIARTVATWGRRTWRTRVPMARD